MKYTDTHKEKPKEGEIVYFVASTSSEVLGTFKYPNLFSTIDGSIRGYYSRWWRRLDELELMLISKQ